MLTRKFFSAASSLRYKSPLWLGRPGTKCVRRTVVTLSATCVPDHAARATCAGSGATLADAPLRIVASGLPVSAKVTLMLSLKIPEEKLSFRSKALFTTTDTGEIDCERDAALPGGSYQGVNPMGLFSRMAPTDAGAVTAGELHDALMVKDVSRELEFRLQAFQGHLIGEEAGTTEDFQEILLGEKTIPRRYFFPSRVRRRPLRAGRVRGTLFVPADGPRGGSGSPLAVTVYGGVLKGAVMEEKAAVLASYGFSTLALAFYGVDDLPKRYGDLDEISVEYFEEALDAAATEEGVDGSMMAIVGSSKGGDLALSCAAFLGDKLKAVIALNACIASVANKTTYKGQVIEPISFGTITPERLKFTDDGRIDPLGFLDDLYKNERAIIPFERCSADVLLQAGEDDHNYDSAYYAREGGRRMAEAGKENFEVVVYPGMGHQVQLPYSPGTFDSLHPLAPPGIRLYMGGDKDKEAHFRGQKAAWDKTVRFLGRTLGVDTDKTNKGRAKL